MMWVIGLDILNRLNQKAKKLIFIYVFGHGEKCSSTNNSNFKKLNLVLDESGIKYSYCINRNVAWSFYSLNDQNNDLKQYFKDTRCQIPHNNLVYKSVAESKRKERLKVSIAKNCA